MSAVSLDLICQWY